MCPCSNFGHIYNNNCLVRYSYQITIRQTFTMAIFKPRLFCSQVTSHKADWMLTTHSHLLFRSPTQLKKHACINISSSFLLVWLIFFRGSAVLFKTARHRLTRSWDIESNITYNIARINFQCLSQLVEHFDLVVVLPYSPRYISCLEFKIVRTCIIHWHCYHRTI